MGVFDDTIRFLDQIGVADVLLPFFLVFAVTFAIMERAKPLGENRRVNLIVALVLGFAVIFPHATNPGGRFDVVPVINNALPQAAAILIAILVLLLLLGIMGGKFSARGNYAGIIAVIAVIAVIWIFVGASGSYFRLPYWLSNPQTIGIIVTLLVFGLVIFFIAKPEKQEGDDKDGIIKSLGTHVKGFNEGGDDN